jgi:hypothetical protein
MNVTGGERYAGLKARLEMINLMTFLNSLTRIEVALSNVDKAVRAVGERANRRAQNQRWMNG